MNLPLDCTRCNGASCQTKDDCKRFTNKADAPYFWLQDALKGCIGFIPHVDAYPEPKQQSTKRSKTYE